MLYLRQMYIQVHKDKPNLVTSWRPHYNNRSSYHSLTLQYRESTWLYSDDTSIGYKRTTHQTQHGQKSKKLNL